MPPELFFEGSKDNRSGLEYPTRAVHINAAVSHPQMACDRGNELCQGTTFVREDVSGHTVTSRRGLRNKFGNSRDLLHTHGLLMHFVNYLLQAWKLELPNEQLGDRRLSLTSVEGA